MYCYKVRVSIREDCKNYKECTEKLDTLIKDSNLEAVGKNEYGSDEFDDCLELVSLLGGEDWFLDNAKELVLINEEEAEDAEGSYEEDSLEYYLKKRKKRQNNKGAISIFLIIGLLILGFVIFFVVFFIANGVKSTKWEREVLTDNEQRDYIAQNELLMPYLSSYLIGKSKVGLRDMTYGFDSVWFDSLDELLDAIYVDSDVLRDELMYDLHKFELDSSEQKEIVELEGDGLKIYIIPSGYLPLEKSNSRKDDWENGYHYEYYILMDESDRARLLCMKVGY